MSYGHVTREVHKHWVFALLFLADASPQCAAWFHYGCR